jgi:hypothetical protein
MASTFKVGDKVVNDIFGPGEIVYGPYGDDLTSYFMKAENGLHHTVTGSLLSPAAKFKVGDVARGSVSGQGYTIEGGPFFGPVEWYAAKRGDGTVTKLNATQLRPVEPARTVQTANVAVHDGVIYDLTARYRDSDGDYWTFKRVDDVVRGAFSGLNLDRSDYITEYSDTLAEAVKDYGPFRKI